MILLGMVILALLFYGTIFFFKKRDVIIYDDGRIVDKYDGTVYEKDANSKISPKY